MFWLFLVLTAAAGYLLGNLNGAILVSKLLLREDVRTHGSGNAGLTNFFRSYGGAKTLLVLAIDVGKTLAAAFLGAWLLGRFGMADLGEMVGGTATILGHMFPAAFQFRGGKGILCGATLGGVLDWRILAALLAVFLIAVVLTRYVSLGSCLGAVVFTPAVALCYPGRYLLWVLALAVSLGALYMHRGNLSRIVHGTESKLSFRRKPRQ